MGFLSPLNKRIKEKRRLRDIYCDQSGTAAARNTSLQPPNQGIQPILLPLQENKRAPHRPSQNTIHDSSPLTLRQSGKKQYPAPTGRVTTMTANSLQLIRHHTCIEGMDISRSPQKQTPTPLRRPGSRALRNRSSTRHLTYIQAVQVSIKNKASMRSVRRTT